MMDKTEFTAAVLEAEQTLYRVAKTMLGSEHDCADAAQQAILRAWGTAWNAPEPQVLQNLADAHPDQRVQRHASSAAAARAL